MNAELQNKIWKAPAKLNLFLHITGQRQDGYHNLQTVFQFLDYSDELQFKCRQDNAIHRHYNTSGIDPENDLIVKAATLLQQEAAKMQLGCTGLDIFLNKKLPMGGGLGGGSSDAATTLVALNELWQLHLSQSHLARLGLQLGADVPVFINGRAVWAEGVGEKFTSMELLEPWYVVLMPAVHVSTAEIFKHPALNRDKKPITQHDFEQGQSENVFEVVVRQQYPEVDFAINWLQKYTPAKMTGTGACVFAQFPNQEKCLEVLQSLPSKLEGFIARGQNFSPLYKN